MSIAIIDYGSGNLRSAEKAFAHVSASLPGAREVRVTNRAEDILKAEHIVLPGVGAFGDCAQGVRAIEGMEEALRMRVRQQAYPFLGICVGMQLMCETGQERGQHDGFGWIGGTVAGLDVGDELKVPHMGWNDLVVDSPHPVLDGIETGAHAYFVHSYHVRVTEPGERIAHVDYGSDVTAVIGRDTMVGMQFHPEKSQDNGLRMIANFLRWAP